MKKFLIGLTIVVVIVGLLVGAGFWAFKGTNVRTITYDKELDDNVVMLVKKDKDNKEELIDIKTIKFVNLCDELVIQYSGAISTQDGIVSGGNYMGINGVRKTVNGRYIVVGDVEIGFVKNAGIQPIEPLQPEL